MEYKGKIIEETELAILIRVDGWTDWYPKSQIERSVKFGDEIEFDIPEWLAEEKGIA